jgi:hypothetical protein
MVLDDDIAARNEAWGYKRAPVHAVDKSSVDNDAVDKAAARRAYKAEHERLRRAKQKAPE